jgi:hypothetical protein
MSKPSSEEPMPLAGFLALVASAITVASGLIWTVAWVAHRLAG